MSTDFAAPAARLVATSPASYPPEERLMTESSTVTTVACPAWCNVSQSTHQQELHWEGRALHWSDARTGDGWEIRHSIATDAQGICAEDAPRLYVETFGGLSLAGAESLALTLLAAYEEAAG